ncbi:MAG: hypothetical protein QOD77_1756 [Thermoplasmata archaeon]|jgi:hypothetical protein|nr:hypothetical protein [Thermoplasmata archaeon]
MRGFLVLVLASFLVVPATALPPLTPVYAYGVIQDNGNFRLEWSPPATGTNGMTGYRVERYVDGVLDDAIVVAASVHAFIDDVVPTGLVYYIVYWANAEGVSPGSNPVVRGEYPPCNWFYESHGFPGYDLKPECLVPPV